MKAQAQEVIPEPVVVKEEPVEIEETKAETEEESQLSFFGGEQSSKKTRQASFRCKRNGSTDAN